MGSLQIAQYKITKEDTMRYFIAYLLDDSVTKYHHSLVNELSERFDLNIGIGLFPTHITLKAPFVVIDVTEIKEALREFASTHYAPSFTIQKFGCFDKRVVFLDVSLNEILSTVVWDMQNAIKKIPNLSWGEHEPLKNLHITVAKNFDSTKFNAIWSYLMQKNAPLFELSFNNIALLRLENNVWVVDSIYYLNH